MKPEFSLKLQYLWATVPSVTMVFQATKLYCLWKFPMGNQYPVVPLGYTGETICSKSHKRSRSRMGFELQLSDVLFCACTISSHFSQASFHSGQFLLPSTFPSCQWCSLLPPACPHMGHVLLQGVPKRLEEHLAPSKGRSRLCVMASLSSSPAKSAKMRVRITTFPKTFWPVLQVSVTS